MASPLTTESPGTHAEATGRESLAAARSSGESEKPGAWFWRRLEQAQRDFDALPAWMKKKESK